MSKNTIFSRRLFLIRSLGASTSLTAAALLASSCQKKEASQEATSQVPLDPCEDFSGLTEKDLAARKQLGYVESSPIADSRCGNCQLWLPPQNGKACGTCQLFKGPVYTTAYCTYWAPQHSDS
ncbi:hypothetical protein GCM10027275_23220 [Rhabdobacter roseus]|uniref:High-potential iron-sulfur protein n=1 Tax=Rhabdobacter roseus TaxID=1655419 RepID=A0A840TRS8_9BACT|nr:high-potential iron-sulfur protein [Rhabdobacter roseus]MBB5284262.1 hypothetical protein [Rhabdobacter roseus]